MPTNTRKHQIIRDKTVQGIDGYDGKMFKAFARGETLPFTIKFTTNPIVTDLSGYKFYASMTSSVALSCSDMTDAEFAEAELTYDGQSTDDSNIYIFSGKITDEQTIKLPDGKNSVIGAMKCISPLGDSVFADKALITVFPCRNPRIA
jgi:hypothetical protein